MLSKPVRKKWTQFVQWQIAENETAEKVCGCSGCEVLAVLSVTAGSNNYNSKSCPPFRVPPFKAEERQIQWHWNPNDIPFSRKARYQDEHTVIMTQWCLQAFRSVKRDWKARTETLAECVIFGGEKHPSCKWSQGTQHYNCTWLTTSSSGLAVLPLRISAGITPPALTSSQGCWGAQEPSLGAWIHLAYTEFINHFKCLPPSPCKVL